MRLIYDAERINNPIISWLKGVRTIQLAITRNKNSYNGFMRVCFGPFGLRKSRVFVKENVSFQEILMTVMDMCDSLGSDCPLITIIYNANYKEKKC